MLHDVEEGENYYDRLGVSRGASHSEIRKAFSQLSLKLHPDKNNEEGATERYQKIVFAYEVVTDEEKRNEYHSLLDEGIPWHQKYYGKYAHRYGAPDHDIRYVLSGLIAFITIAKFLYQHYRRYTLLGLVKRTDRYQRAMRKKQQEQAAQDPGSVDKKKKKKNVDEEPELRWYLTDLDWRSIWSALFETDDKDESESVVTEDGLEVQIVGAEKPKFRDLFIVQLILFPYTFSVWAYSMFNIHALGKVKTPEEIEEELRLRLKMTQQEFQEHKQKMQEYGERLKSSGKYKRAKRFMKNRTPSAGCGCD